MIADVTLIEIVSLLLPSFRHAAALRNNDNFLPIDIVVHNKGTLIIECFIVG